LGEKQQVFCSVYMAVTGGKHIQVGECKILVSFKIFLGIKNQFLCLLGLRWVVDWNCIQKQFGCVCLGVRSDTTTSVPDLRNKKTVRNSQKQSYRNIYLIYPLPQSHFHDHGKKYKSKLVNTLFSILVNSGYIS
jgi:hypothetical protein